MDWKVTYVVWLLLFFSEIPGARLWEKKSVGFFFSPQITVSFRWCFSLFPCKLYAQSLPSAALPECHPCTCLCFRVTCSDSGMAVPVLNDSSPRQWGNIPFPWGIFNCSYLCWPYFFFEMVAKCLAPSCFLPCHFMWVFSEKPVHLKFWVKGLVPHLECPAWRCIQQPLGREPEWTIAVLGQELWVLCCPWHQLGQSPMKSLGEIPGRSVVMCGSAPVPAVVGHLFPADLFREGWSRKKSTVTSALSGSSVTAPPSPLRIKTNISSCILMKHLKVDLLLLFTRTVLIFFWPFSISPCVFVLGFFFIFPSYLFDLVLHAAFFFEVIGELVIRDQLDSSWLMTEPGYQGNKAGTLTVTPAPSLHPYLLWKGHRAGLCKDKAGNKISNRQIQNFGYLFQHLGKQVLLMTSCFEQDSCHSCGYLRWYLDSWRFPRNSSCLFIWDSISGVLKESKAAFPELDALFWC